MRRPQTDEDREAVGFYRAGEVALKLQLAKPTVYEIAKQDPARLGAERFGRAVRFRRSVVDRLVNGAG